MANSKITCSGASGCGASWFGLKLEHCTACHQSFTTTRGGDMHLLKIATGKWRCKTVVELREEGKLAEIRSGTWARAGMRGAAALDPTLVKDDTPGIWGDLELAG